MGKVVCPWDTLINFVTDALKATAVTALSRFILTELKQVFKIRLLTLRWLRKPLAPQ